MKIYFKNILILSGIFITIIYMSSCDKEEVKSPNAEYTISKAIYDTTWSGDHTSFTTSLNHYEDNVSEAKVGQEIKIKRTGGSAEMTVVWLGDSIHDYYNQNYHVTIKSADKVTDSLVVKKGSALAWSEKQDSAIYQFNYAVDDPKLIQSGKAPADGMFKIVIISTNVESGSSIAHQQIEKKIRVTK
jgi:hypothetical protein